MANTHRGVAVSLTPVALDGDSRALRIANSLAEMGFRSIVIEGKASKRQCWGPNIEIFSAGRANRRGAAMTSPASGRWGRRMVSPLRDGRFGALGELGLYFGFRGYDWWRFHHRPGHLLPPATLYYLHSFEYFRAVAPLARSAGSRIIYDAHDFYRGIEPPTALRSFDRNHLRPFLDRLENRVVAEAHAVVTVSDGVASLMHHCFGRRPVVIRNFHDDRLDRADAPDLRATCRRESLRVSDMQEPSGNWWEGVA